jgi:hypothetical protein
VIAFGLIRMLEDAGDKRRALSNLLQKYFPQMKSGEEYRPITDEELKRTSGYATSIESWSSIFGKPIPQNENSPVNSG